MKTLHLCSSLAGDSLILVSRTQKQGFIQQTIYAFSLTDGIVFCSQHCFYDGNLLCLLSSVQGKTKLILNSLQFFKQEVKIKYNNNTNNNKQAQTQSSLLNASE